MSKAPFSGDESEALVKYVKTLEKALLPFAEYADPYRTLRGEFVITMGSLIAKRQLYMSDCYAAADALKGPEPSA